MSRSVKWILLLSLLMSCQEQSTQTGESLSAGRRDYVWTIDTLDVAGGPPSMAIATWGASPTDIWTVGFGFGELWRYDGQYWKKISLNYGSRLNSVFGFGATDVWFAGDGGLLHYDGSQINIQPLPRDTAYPNLSLVGVWGDSPTNVYAIGRATDTSYTKYIPAFLHYDGVQWQSVPIPFLPNTDFFRMRRSSLQTNTYYIAGTKSGDDGGQRLYTFESGTLTEIYVSPNEIRFPNDVGQHLYFTVSGKSVILREQGGNFTVWKDFTSAGYVIDAITGRHEKDMFFASLNYDSSGQEAILHYDGEKMVKLYEIKAWLYRPVIFETDVFFPIGLTGGTATPAMLHGKLQPKKEVKQ